MFRREALRQGVLKTINANTGVMVGPAYTAPGVPAIRKPPTFMERMKVSGPVRGIKSLGRQTVNPAILGGYYAGDKVAQGLGIESTVGRMGFGLGGSYAASRMLPAAMGLGVLPSAAILGTVYGGKKLYDAGVKERARINAMSPAERKAFEIQQRNSAFDYMSASDEELFGKEKTIEEKVEEDKRIVNKNVGSGRVSGPGFTMKSKELKAEGDELLQNANDQDIANLDLIQENTLTGGTPPPTNEDDTNYTMTLAEDRERREAEALLTAPEKKAQKKQSIVQGNNEINAGGSTNDPIFNQRIELAKKYFDELDKGQGSQANLVFLSNLASGLLTGTTKKAGIGGALEVFGQAIGPAVNNYSTIKLKEGELRARRREAGLQAAFDHMKFLNDGAKEGETVERERGVVQIRGADGRLRNYKAYTRKDGRIEMATFDEKTQQEVFVPVIQGADIEDTSGKKVGRFEDFIPQKIYSKRLQEIEDILGNRYAALATTRDVLKTLRQTDADNKQVRAGASLSIDTVIRRATGVAKDILDIDLASDAKEAAIQAEQFYQDEMNKIQDALDNGEITDSEAKGERKLIDKENLKANILKRIKRKGTFSGLSGADQEKLAVQEVTLVYALANTFKDQDRLTQRDINAAQKIVNIFSLARSSQDVRDSIGAIGNQLEADINRQEIAYTKSGGLETSLTDLRAQQNFKPFGEGESIPQGLQSEFDTEEKIKNELEGLGL